MPATTSAEARNPETSSSAGRLHLGYLDGVRGLAALFVVLHHNWYTVWVQGEDAAPRWTDWLSFGHFAVDVFLVLSGFCLMLPVVGSGGHLRGGAAAFFQKRARRILPPYYAALGLSLLFIFLLIGRRSGGFWDSALPVTGRGILVHLLLLQDFSVAELHTINYVFWSISLEWWIYFLFPALVWAWKRFGAGKTAAVSVVAAYILWGVCSHEFHNTFTVHFIALFVLGMLGCELAHTRTEAVRVLRDRIPWGAASGAALVVTSVAMTGRIRHFSSGDLIDLLVGLVTLCLLVLIGLRPSSLLKMALSQPAVVFLGSFAYSLYLIHAPLIAVLWQYVISPMRLAPLTAFVLLEIAGTPLIVACAYLFHLAFERPFMSKPAPRSEAQAEAAAVISPAP